MSIRDILIFLFKWKGTLLGITAAVVAATTVFVYVVPESYEAIASVVVEENRAPTLRSALIPGVDAALVMNTEMELIKSRTVLTRVVDELKPHERPSRSVSAVKAYIKNVRVSLAELGLITILDPREAWIKRLSSRVQVDHVLKSNVITISYAEPDPEWAAKITNAVTDGYILHHWEVFSASGNTERFLAQLNESRQALDQLRLASAEYKQSVSAHAITDSQRTLLLQLRTFREQRSDYEIQMAALRSRFEDDHEEVRLIRRNIAQLRQQEADVGRQLLELERNGAKVAAFEADVRAAEDYYLTSKRQFEEAHLSDSSSIELINVRVSDRAVVPVQPAYSRLLLLAVGLVAGLMVAFSLAITLEYFDRRVATPETAEEILGIPDFGSVESFGFLQSLTGRLLGYVHRNLTKD